jgi:hypothetical protein
MSRACASSIALLIMVLSAFAAPAQPLPAAQIACPRAVFPPVLDGRLDDWPRLPQVVISGVGQWQTAAAQFADQGRPEDISAEARLVWDNQAFYLAVQTRDDSFVRVGDAADIDRGGDSLVLTVTDDAAAIVNQFVVAWLKDGSFVWRTELAARVENVRTIGRALSAQPEEDGGSRVVYELAIPWSELKPIRPIAGASFTLLISACDDDGQGIEGCLEAAIPVVLSTATVTGLEPQPDVLPPSLPPTFPAPSVARFDRKCFTFRGQDTLMFGGWVDYARLPREAWSHRLGQLGAAGMNTVSAVVPWSYHQPTPGEADLRTLEDFLLQCKDTGLLAQLHLGPYAGDRWEAGAIPGWVLSMASGERKRAAIDSWDDALLNLVARYQLATGGPIASVVIRPIPDAESGREGPTLETLFARLRSAKIGVPVLTANAPSARSNSRQTLANILDTVTFYTAPAPPEMISRLRALSRAENGPAVITGLPGDYRTQPAARESIGLAKIALAGGAGGIALSDFAPGIAVAELREGGDQSTAGIIDPAGAPTPGWGEARLLGGFLQRFGPALARAMPAEGVVQTDDPQVRAAARLSSQEGFVFLWDEQRAAPHQVRLTYIEPGTETAVNIPEAGAIYLPPGEAKILPLDVPLGRGTLRYTTSEVAGVHPSAERTLLVLYGDLDTPGELALQWPGPPLVLGEAVRQSWDPTTKTLVLDYYHGHEDQYLLVDELEVIVLSRGRAAFTTAIAGPPGAVVLSAGVHAGRGSLGSDGLQAVLECPAGVAHVTAVVPKRPSAVTVDGEPVEFSFTSPARILTFDVPTESFEQGRRASSIWDQMGRAITGGPPKLYARFDRAWFMPDASAPPGSWAPVEGLGVSTDVLGLAAGSIVRLRARFHAAGPAEVVMVGSTDPSIVSVNGQVVPALSGSAAERRASVADLLQPGENQIEILLHLLPRAPGRAGLLEPAKRLPEVMLVGAGGQIVLDKWEVSPGLAGEAAGWAKPEFDARRWHLLRFGPWRGQGREPSEVWGAAWYRVPFGLPRSDGWRIPYHMRLTLDGTARLYLNGTPLATCRSGEHVLPLPVPPLREGADNVLAIAAYGLGSETGLHQLEIAADEGRMTRQRVLAIHF